MPDIFSVDIIPEGGIGLHLFIKHRSRYKLIQGAKLEFKWAEEAKLGQNQRLHLIINHLWKPSE